MEKTAECVLLNVETMTAKEITASNLLGLVNANNFGDISVLFVENVESAASFGIITGTVKGSDETISGYKIYSDSTEVEYQSNMNATGLGVGVPVVYELSGNRIDSIYKLYQIKSGTVKAVDSSRIRVGDEVYNMSAAVEIVKEGRNLSYSTISIDELANMKNADVTVYSDTSSKGASVIRVVVVK